MGSGKQFNLSPLSEGPEIGDGKAMNTVWLLGGVIFPSISVNHYVNILKMK